MPNTLLESLRTHDEAFRSRARLASLYSDFTSQRSTNPDGYTANSTTWLRALSSAARNGVLPSGRFVIEIGLLGRELECEFGRPLALEAVFEDAVRRGEIFELGEFLGRREGLYKRRSSWVPGLGEVVGWGLRLLGVGGGGRFVEGVFVVVGNVETAAKSVLEYMEKTATSPSSRIFSRELFETTFAPILGMEGLSKDDLSILLTHLARDQEAATYDPISGTLKFKSPSESQPSPITSEDISIASLRTLISNLEPQISRLSTQISKLGLSAREAVGKKQLHSAKISLRQKKAAETKFTQRSAMLMQLEDVYAKIEQASDQVELVEVLEQSGAVLKSLNQKIGGVERVQDVMDELREGMLDVEEIGSAIQEVAAGEVDEGEVEDELEGLERSEREKREVEEGVEREKREAEERVERERKEVEEAEITRLRLAKLESVSGGGEELESTKEVQMEAEKNAA